MMTFVLVVVVLYLTVAVVVGRHRQLVKLCAIETGLSFLGRRSRKL